MTKRMLIDASHAEETRVVVLDGNRLEDFDLEAANRLPLKGNIYLAKVVRVEPSLQAAFVEYGGNRHGFLPLAEIHPDYYQIPVADRQRLLAMQAAEARAEEAAEEEDAAEAESEREAAVPEAEAAPDAEPASDPEVGAEAGAESGAEPFAVAAELARDESSGEEPEPVLVAAQIARDEAAEPVPVSASEAPPDVAEDATALPLPGDSAASTETHTSAALGPMEVAAPEAEPAAGAESAEPPAPSETATIAEQSGPFLLPGEGDQPAIANAARAAAPNGRAEDAEGFESEDAPPPEDIGGEAPEEVARERRGAARFMRQYKIQEVIKRRQIMLVQVVKEERGTKGAALTTYISLAGRFSVLMPNSPRGGGVSRKITSADRPPAPARGDRRAGAAGRHEPDRPHRRRAAPEARDPARLRIPAAPLGQHPRTHPGLLRAGADLRGSGPHQALHPRQLRPRRGRGAGGRRGRLPGRARVHAHADAAARAEGAPVPRRRRSSPGTGSRRSSTPCTRPWCSSAPAATSSSTRPRRWSPST